MNDIIEKGIDDVVKTRPEHTIANLLKLTISILLVVLTAFLSVISKNVVQYVQTNNKGHVEIQKDIQEINKNFQTLSRTVENGFMGTEKRFNEQNVKILEQKQLIKVLLETQPKLIKKQAELIQRIYDERKKEDCFLPQMMPIGNDFISQIEEEKNLKKKLQ